MENGMLFESCFGSSNLILVFGRDPSIDPTPSVLLVVLEIIFYDVACVIWGVLGLSKYRSPLW